MVRSGSFLGLGLAFVVFGSWALGLWYASGWTWLLKVGGVLTGIGVLAVLANVLFRRLGGD